MAERRPVSDEHLDAQRLRRLLDDPTFNQFASIWLARRRPSYRQRTYEHYRYFLTDHLLPAFAALRLSQLEYAAIDRYVEAKQLEAEEIREAARRGVTLTDASGRRKRPLANSTINATVELLARSSTRRWGASSWPPTRYVRRACG